MSKAGDLSRQYVLPFLDEIYEVYGEHRQMQLSKFDGYDMMSAYEEGYHKAERDLKLTWKDMSLIRLVFDEIEANILLGVIKIQPMTKEYYQEVLKRFKDFKERKEK